jgi:hypothetical protein
MMGTLVGWEQEGDDIFGTAIVPPWLNPLLPTDATISMEFNPDKTPKGIAWALGQIIPDAQLTAAFAEYQKAVGFAAVNSGGWSMLPLMVHPKGAIHQNVVDHMHDHNGKMHSHDHAHAAGVDDHDGDEHLAGHTNAPPVTGKPFMFSEEPERKGLLMGFKDFWTKLQQAGKEEGIDVPNLTTEGSGVVINNSTLAPVPVQFSTASAGTSSLQMANPETDALRKEVRDLRARAINAEATAFADKEVLEERAFPSEREDLLAMFAEAAQDDIALGPILFASSVDSQGQQVAERRRSRTELLIERNSRRPKHGLSQELLPANFSVEMLTNLQRTRQVGDPEPINQDRVTRMKSLTATGRKQLEEERKASRAS